MRSDARNERATHAARRAFAAHAGRVQVPKLRGVRSINAYDSTQSASPGFWMYRTRISLDIAFVDSLGVIRSISHMVPCPATLMEGCPSYPAGAPYRAALEMNAGYFARHKLDVGSKIVLEDMSQRIGQPAGR